MFFHFDPLYFMMIAPALLLAVWAQFRIRSAYARAQQQPLAVARPLPVIFSIRPDYRTSVSKWCLAK